MLKSIISVVESYKAKFYKSSKLFRIEIYKFCLITSLKYEPKYKILSNIHHYQAILFGIEFTWIYITEN